MLVYRVFPHARGARAHQPGHALYVPEQGAGRFDNADRYRVRYLAADPTTAVIERFAGLAWWSAAMFRFPAMPGAAYKLAAIRVADGLAVADLDDPHVLTQLGTRPTGVMSPDRAATQALARAVHDRGDAGIRWWSTWPEHRPLFAIWGGDVTLDHTEELTLDHDAVIAAAGVLGKPIRATNR